MIAYRCILAYICIPSYTTVLLATQSTSCLAVSNENRISNVMVGL